MADSPVHKPAGPHEKAPSAEDLDRLAALIKPSWELEDAPFSMGNRSLTPQEWEQLGVESPQSRPPSSVLGLGAKDGRNGAAMSNGVSGIPEAMAPDVTVPSPPPDVTVPMATRASAPPRVSAPPVFPTANPPSGSGPASVPHARTLTPRSDVAVAVDASAKDWQKTSLSDELSSYPPEKSRKGLYVGLAAAAVVILAGVFFATRSSDTETPSPAPGAASPADEKNPSVSNARVDIPPAPSATQATQTAPAAKELVAKEPAKEAKEPAPAKEVKEPKEPLAREHSRTAPAPPPRAQAPATHNNGVPAAQPATPKASNKNNASGGIVRDVPF